MVKRQRDSFAKQALKEGFPARSVYKLQEIQQRLELMVSGNRVLDLGAAPGSWLQYIANQVGPSGRVVGVDRQEIRINLPKHAEVIQCDALQIPQEQLEQWGNFDVVVSDMAPSTSGHRFTDQTRSFDLYRRALNIATRCLRTGGNFAGKIFQGPDFEQARNLTRQRFDKTRIIRPKATRSESYEIFVVGMGFKPIDRM